MFLIITNTKNPVTLDYPIEGNFKVALHEIFFRVKWTNISESRGNNWISAGDEKFVIPDGYYGFCELQKKLSEFEIDLTLNSANLKLTITPPPSLGRGRPFTIAKPLAKMLGFKNDTFSGETEGDYPMDLAINSLLYVHLDELSTDKNLYDGKSSTILRVIPSGKAAYCDHEIKTFPDLQFKDLARGHHEKLNLRITDPSGNPVEYDDLHIVLEIIKK